MRTSFLSRFTAVAFAALITMGAIATASAQATFFTDRATWQAEITGPIDSEDWEDLSQIAAGAVVGCDAPQNNTTTNACSLPGETAAGLELVDVPGPDAAGLVGCGAGCVGTALPSKIMCHNTFVDLLQVNLTNGDTRAFGGQIAALFGNTDGGTVEAFDAGDNSLGSWVSPGVIPDDASLFVGITSATPIAYVQFTVDDVVGNNVSCWDDIEFSNAIVPVELVSFDAVVDGQDVTLNWATSSETNNAGFEVQVQNGATWNALGFVEGNGTTTEAQTYSFGIDNMGVGTHVFRLKQIDYDGAFNYHGDVEVSIETPGTHVLTSAYPNPFNPQAQFTLAVAQEQVVAVELYNTLGQRVAVLFNGTVEANQAQQLTIDGAGLASGMYVVRVNGERFADAFTVTLLK